MPFHGRPVRERVNFRIRSLYEKLLQKYVPDKDHSSNCAVLCYGSGRRPKEGSRGATNEDA